MQHVELSLQNEAFWFATLQLKLAEQCGVSLCG